MDGHLILAHARAEGSGELKRIPLTIDFDTAYFDDR